MKKTNKFFAIVLILAFLFTSSVIISAANDDDISKTHFMIYIKEEYSGRVQEVIDSVDCEYIGEVRELTDPGNMSVYTPVLLVWVKDKNEDNFYKAQEYFFDKDYYYKTWYDYLIGDYPETKLVRDHFILIVKEEYAEDIDSIIEGIDSSFIAGVEEAEYFLPSADRRVPLYVFLTNGDEAFFTHAQQYFDDKDYADSIEYNYLFYNYDFVLFGDADNDGIYTASDARFILRCSVGLEKYDSIMQCDINRDNDVSAEDARMVLRYSVGVFD